MATDPLWGNVALFANFEQPAPAEFIDFVRYLKFSTLAGPEISTPGQFSDQAFSITSSSSGDGLFFPASAATKAQADLGSANFTIELHYASATTSSTVGRCFLSHWVEAAGGRSWEFYRAGASQEIGFRYSTNGSDNLTLASPTVSAWGATWRHLCVQRIGTSLYLYKDGVQVATASIGTATIFSPLVAASAPLVIGRRGADTTTTFNQGRYDNVRITKGVARYAAAGFTPPTASFPTTDAPASGGATQALALVADVSNRPARVTQSVSLLLVAELIEARISQSVALLADPAVRPALITQSVAYVAVLAEPCETKRCQVWTITRRDGVVLGFTSHDQDVLFRGLVHQSCASLNPSASENAADVGSVANIELEGIISSDAISEADLFGGVYDDAYVEVWLVPWGAVPDEAHRLAAGWTGSLSQGDAGFSMEVLGPGSRLEQQALVDFISPSCRWIFGSAECGVNAEALAVAGSVSFANRRGSFLAVLGAPGAAQWANGRVRFTSGPNADTTVEVKSVDFGTGQVVLWASPPFLPLVGDDFDLLPGCDKIIEGGCAVYANQINFGGFPDVPGDDSLLETPNAKY